MKILHTADLHLKSFRDERWNTLEKLIEIGIKEEIDFLVICGDIFDKDPDAENLRLPIREIFSNNDFKIILLPGNHDEDSYKSGLYFGKDTILLSELSSFEYEDVRFIGMPFEALSTEEILSRIRELKKIASDDKKNILLYHGELLDSFMYRDDFGNEGQERYMPVKLSYFRDTNLNYILAGHFHTNFDVKQLDNGGYFVYPGSPISITKKEVGKRKVNIFEVGESPKEYILDTPHYAEVVIEFDPFIDKNPINIVKEYYEKVHSEAKVILTVKGYINSQAIQMTEGELVKEIEKIFEEKIVGQPSYEFRDIKTILENELFKIFMHKLNQTDYDAKMKERIQDVTIKAMMEAGK